jgi:serine/threonine protein phosphatase PrpC
MTDILVPHSPRPPSFQSGAATHQAQRDSNEDQASAGTFPGGGYVIVADGVGGEAWGHLASKTARCWAEASLLRYLQAMVDTGAEPDLGRVLSLAFRNAHKGLVRQAAVGGYRFGLKTTLIIGVVYRKQAAVGHVGDGGSWCWHEGMELPRPLLSPMANGAGELAAVLSPWSFQEPSIQVQDWPGQGVLIAATDGVSDPLPPAGVAYLARSLQESSAPLQELLEQLLQACHAETDAVGPIFMDNMGVAALRRRSV